MEQTNADVHTLTTLMEYTHVPLSSLSFTSTDRRRAARGRQRRRSERKGAYLAVAPSVRVFERAVWAYANIRATAAGPSPTALAGDLVIHLGRDVVQIHRGVGARGRGQLRIRRAFGYQGSLLR